MTKIIDLQQGSDDWLAWRKNVCSASDAGVIMGDVQSWSPVKTWDDLRIRQAGRRPPRSAFLDRAAARGHEKEKIARKELEAKHGYQFPPTCLQSDDGRFGASLDGGHVAASVWIEIKAPIHGERSKLYRALADDREIPRAYWWQLVHQYFLFRELCVAPPRCVFHVWTDGGGIERVIDDRSLEADSKNLLAMWKVFLGGD